MPANQFLAEALQDVGHGELVALTGHLAVEHHLEQEVAQLLAQMVEAPLVDRLDHLVRFLDQVGLERIACLLSVPWATAFASQASHDGKQ
jgi:hypothetical protein